MLPSVNRHQRQELKAALKISYFPPNKLLLDIFSPSQGALINTIYVLIPFIAFSNHKSNPEWRM